ncbi:MAG: cytochrome d ubiquinol oxidase subunit II [Bacteriovoracia bacterium]
MIEFIVIVLGVALFLYAFLAGADFGAGIIEILPTKVHSKEKMKFIGKAMGPVWEANHIWLILALVIVFNAFPDIFWFFAEWFHYPLGALAIGIIFRGASFSFLHYDPIIDKSQTYYHWIFGLSSLWCALWLGIMTGSLMLGNFLLTDTGIYERYFGHWLNPFALSMGVFVTLLMMFNASLFLSAESEEKKVEWQVLTRKILSFLIVSGLLVHVSFYLTSPERWKVFFLNPFSIGLILLSFLLLYPQFYTIGKQRPHSSRIIAGAQLLCIMGAGFIPLYPNILVFRDLTSLSVYTAAAERPVLRLLIIALIFGLFMILPPYIYMMKIFKTKKMRP